MRIRLTALAFLLTGSRSTDAFVVGPPGGYMPAVPSKRGVLGVSGAAVDAKQAGSLIATAGHAVDDYEVVNSEMRGVPEPGRMHLSGPPKLKLSTARHVSIGSGECMVVGAGAPVSAITTDGIGCCVALAMRGESKEDRHQETLMAHLDSQQYLPPGDRGASVGNFGGKTDAELETDDDMRQENRAATVKKARAFTRSHDNVEVLAATNYLHHPVNLGQCLFLKLSIAPPPNVQFLAEESVLGGRVELDVDTFQMYKTDPQTGERLADILDLPTVSSARSIIPKS